MWLLSLSSINSLTRKIISFFVKKLLTNTHEGYIINPRGVFYGDVNYFKSVNNRKAGLYER